MLVIVTTEDEDGKNISSSLMGDDDGVRSYSLQVIGKIMEVFGPVQRPLYVIRLPEPSSSCLEKDTDVKKEGKSNAKMNNDRQSDQLADDKEAQVSSTDDTNEIEIEASEEDEKEETSRVQESDSSKEDPWNADGALTTMIKSCSSTPVYCLMNHANLIDTDQIIRGSDKGCDASNMHDEEVGAKEQEYSDDEEERQAKRKGKKKSARDNNDQRADINRGKRAGRRDGSRGNNRGGRRGNWKGGNGHNQAYQSHYPQQPNFGYPPPQQMNHGPPQHQRQMYQAHLPQNYAHTQPHYQIVPQYQYQQQHLYQQQPYQQQQQYVAYQHGPPLPPPPPPMQATQTQQTTESDTVYYVRLFRLLNLHSVSVTSSVFCNT